jgi:hypothetical protein
MTMTRRRALRRSAAAAVNVLLMGATACDTSWISPEPPPTAVDSVVTPKDLQKFIGTGLVYDDRGDFGLDQAQLLTTTDAPGGVLLRVSYPAGSASRAAGGPDGGTQAYLRLPDTTAPTDTLDLRYQLRFPPDFDFVKGGKLPGLYGGTVTSGQHIPDGTNGFSTRYMWRTDGAGEVYAYLPTSQQHGTSLGRGCWTFTPGRWTQLHQRITLNTPGLANGRITVWQDDRLVLDHPGLAFRTTPDLHIDGLFFSTFFGGDDSSWASPTDQHADFADFTLTSTVLASPVHTGPPGYGPAGCTAAGWP